MFTGLIQDIGTLEALDKRGDWVATIAAQKLADRLMPGLPSPERSSGFAQAGASIACDGICLTVIENGGGHFKVQISGETLSRTTAVRWRKGQRINLEPALRLGDELGGHMLAGHVDGIARVVTRKALGDSLVYTFEAPPECAKFMASKGSVALNGVSLTVNEVTGTRFTVMVIPYTLGATNLDALATGDEVNFEADMVARYVARGLELTHAQDPASGG
jgi:riboflavin synthase